MIASQFPTAAVGHTMPIALPRERLVLLQAVWSSFVFDFVARQKVGGTHMTYGYLEQLATIGPDYRPPWPGDSEQWFVARVGYLQAARSWATPGRSAIRAELDAAMFILYGVERDDVEYIMGTFPIVRRNDEREHGEYRTKRLILEVYDVMQQAIGAGMPYQSPWDYESLG